MWPKLDSDLFCLGTSASQWFAIGSRDGRKNIFVNLRGSSSTTVTSSLFLVVNLQRHFAILPMKNWFNSSLALKTPCFESNPLKFVALWFVAIYRTVGTTHLGGACRFSPSCSEYAVQALNEHLTLSALKLICLRVLKCRPGGPCGWDPVPPPQKNGNTNDE